METNATRNNSVPLEVGKQLHTGKKSKVGPAKFQPKFVNVQDHGE